MKTDLYLAAKRLSLSPDFKKVLDAFIEARKEMVFNVPYNDTTMLQLTVTLVHALEELKTYIETLANEDDENAPRTN